MQICVERRATEQVWMLSQSDYNGPTGGEDHTPASLKYDSPERASFKIIGMATKTVARVPSRSWTTHVLWLKEITKLQNAGCEPAAISGGKRSKDNPEEKEYQTKKKGRQSTTWNFLKTWQKGLEMAEILTMMVSSCHKHSHCGHGRARPRDSQRQATIAVIRRGRWAAVTWAVPNLCTCSGLCWVSYTRQETSLQIWTRKSIQLFKRKKEMLARKSRKWAQDAQRLVLIVHQTGSKQMIQTNLFCFLTYNHHFYSKWKERESVYSSLKTPRPCEPLRLKNTHCIVENIHQK